MALNRFMPVVPSSDLRRSLRLWRDGLGFDRTWYEEERDGVLVGCGLGNGAARVMLNIRAPGPEKPAGYDGVRFYWTPEDLVGLRDRLAGLGYAVSEIDHRYYGQSEFLLIDDDGYSHCFGVPTESLAAQP